MVPQKNAKNTTYTKHATKEEVGYNRNGWSEAPSVGKHQEKAHAFFRSRHENKWTRASGDNRISQRQNKEKKTKSETSRWTDQVDLKRNIEWRHRRTQRAIEREKWRDVIVNDGRHDTWWWWWWRRRRWWWWWWWWWRWWWCWWWLLEAIQNHQFLIISS